MFGTNDSKTYQWNYNDFLTDYTDLINSFIQLDSKPDVYVMVPPPLYQEGAYAMDMHIINEVFPKLIP